MVRSYSLNRSLSFRLSSSPADAARRRQGRQGFTLVATLMVVVLFAALATAAAIGAMSAVRTASADYYGTRAFYAAEAGAEKALADIEMALDDGVLTEAELGAIAPPALAGYQFSEFRVEKEGGIVVERITDGPFSGLYALTQNVDIYSRATDDAGHHAGVVLGGKAQAIPIFQFGFFFEGSGGIMWEGSPWHGYGRMHSNRGLYFHGCDAHFHDVMTTPGPARIEGYASHRPRPLGCAILKNYIDNASGVERLLDFDSDDTPDPEAFKAKSLAYYDGRLMTDAFGVDSLNLPLPDGVAPHSLVEPRLVGDSDAERAVKYSWLADMYVTVDLTDLEDANVACGGPPSDPRAPTRLPRITVTRDHGYADVPNPQWECKIFQFRWESFYDNHEKGWVDVLDLDLAQFRNWTTNPATNADGARIIYVEFKHADAAPVEPSITDRSPNARKDALPPTDYNRGKYYPVLKLINGGQLHGPLSVGSAYTTYVQGDYNTGRWYPAAIFSDVLGVLSNSWSDVKSRYEWDYTGFNCAFVDPDFCPDASPTTQYYAFIASDSYNIVSCYHEDPSCSPPGYRPDGVELVYAGGAGKKLEQWRYTLPCNSSPGKWCTHYWRGSYVVLFPTMSTTPYSNFPGDPYNYQYGSANNHGFDTRFLFPDSLPPGTPMVGAVWRAAFRESY
jgi:hypothetical protein